MEINIKAKLRCNKRKKEGRKDAGKIETGKEIKKRMRGCFLSDILKLSISGYCSSQGYYILLNIIFQCMNRNPFLSLGQREFNYM